MILPSCHSVYFLFWSFENWNIFWKFNHLYGNSELAEWVLLKVLIQNITLHWTQNNDICSINKTIPYDYLWLLKVLCAGGVVYVSPWNYDQILMIFTQTQSFSWWCHGHLANGTLSVVLLRPIIRSRPIGREQRRSFTAFLRPKDIRNINLC